MISYIFKRILLMIPTFVVISMIIFVVLNLAPGDPSAQAASDGTETVSQDAQEAYRLFQEQFNLDKPVILNTRFWLTTDEIEGKLTVIADYQRPVCADDDALAEVEKVEEEKEVQQAVGTPAATDDNAAKAPEEPIDPDALVDPDEEDCTPLAERPGTGQIIDAQEDLTNWGDYAVAHLIVLAKDHDRADIRHLAVNQLSTNARRPQVRRSMQDPPPEIREQNRQISRENNELRRWRVAQDADEDAVAQMVEDNWLPWFEENQQRFEYTTGERVEIFFLDTRFAKYWQNLLRFDFGVSTVDRRPVQQTIMSKLPYTITLGLISILLAYLISVPLGIWSAYNQNSRKDQFVTVLLFMLYSLPSFFTAVLLIQFFAVGRPFDLFPAGGFIGEAARNSATLNQFGSVAWHLVLPVVCLTYGSLAALSRYARTGILDVIRADYIRTARAKGLSESMVILKHAVRNGLIPILTLAGSILPFVVSGSLVIEYIFNIPGIGLYLYESIFMYDYNAIMGCLLISTVMTLVGLLISDISYAVVDPRITFD